MRFRVYGIPQPGGSKRAFFNKSSGKGMVVDANPKAKGWKDTVRASYIDHLEKMGWDPPVLAGPILLRIMFIMPRPMAHFRADRITLKVGAPYFHTKKPDATKLLRSTEDALTKFIWADDSQVMPFVWKVYGNKPGAVIHVESLEDDRGIWPVDDWDTWMTNL